MNCQNVKNQIISFMVAKAMAAKARGFVVGVSGGVDSGLVSTLASLTGMPTILLQLPIHRKEGEISRRANDHCKRLSDLFPNVSCFSHDLSSTFDAFCNTLLCDIAELTGANLRSRLRMVSAYAFANQFQYIVLGTGNKVEDFGVGFFTKYGDGGVDISPIGDLLKSEVRELASYLGVSPEIVNAIPTDELWADTRSDETAIGASYDELEEAMKIYDEWEERNQIHSADISLDDFTSLLSDRQKEVMKIYAKRHNANQHKMKMPPICIVDKN